MEHNPIEVARGISEFGMLAVAAGFFLVVSATVIIWVIRWAMKTNTQLITEFKETIFTVVEETKQQNQLLGSIDEGLKEKTLQQIHTFAAISFDLSKERVSRLIKRIRTENHIDDREATHKKIVTECQALYDARRLQFDVFSWRGFRLSHFTNPDWVRWVSEVVEREIYDTSGENHNRAFSNINLVYRRIEQEFYNNLK